MIIWYLNMADGLEHFSCFHILQLGIIIPTDELIFFRGVVIPPTRNGTPQLNSRLGVYYNPGYSYYRTYYIAGHILFNVLISPYSWQSKTFGPGFRRPEVKQEDPRRFTNIQVYISIYNHTYRYVCVLHEFGPFKHETVPSIWTNGRGNGPDSDPPFSISSWRWTTHPQRVSTGISGHHYPTW